MFARLRVGDRFTTPRVVVHPLGTLCMPIALRPETSDALAFEAAFVEYRHLPPFRLPKGSTVLDLGCGGGYSCASFAMRDPACRVLGVELDADATALAQENAAAFGARVRIMRGAAWGETGEVALGGSDGWSRRVVQLDAYPGMDRIRPVANAPAFSMTSLMDAFVGWNVPVDHVHMDIAGSEATVFDQPARWLAGRVRSIRVHVSPPTRIERVESRLVEQGLIVRLDPRDERVVIGMTREFAAEQPRFPRDSSVLEEAPPPY